MKKSAIITELGIINGRDALYLSKASFKDGMNTFVLEGEVNGRLCSEKQKTEFINYEIIFKRVLALKMIELDSWDFDSVSNFDDIEQSEWIKELGGKVTTKQKHLFVQTYDEVFDIVCDGYEFKIIN